ISKLKQLFPELITEDASGAKIDVDVLNELVGHQVIDGDKERYNFTWHGKAAARRLAQTPSTGTLRPCKKESKDWGTTQNLFIEGDNLEVLKLLQKSYHKKVKMIYIDPPYNTGKDFIYKDNFKDSVSNYKKITGQIDDEGYPLKTNPETSGRYHTHWLNMIYPRLKLARNLLSEDGVIFISIDEHEINNTRNLLDIVFGENNHLATVSVINNMKGRNSKANISTCHEYLVIYSKSEFESYGLPLNEEQISEYKYSDKNGNKYALRDLRKRGGPDKRSDRPNMYFPIFFNKDTGTCSLTRENDNDIEITPQKGDNSDGRWRWGVNKVSQSLNILHPKYNQKKDKWGIEHRIYLDPSVSSSDNIDEETDDDDQFFERSSKRACK
ncbi:site-specific DNA-methyltransferase, partial [Endozoicomonas atrinae]|uniref:site-specific DNA-methyltransferase n=1 Tax=Endozoicomonas atrinae TaxID=1333660 RepID=UPI000A60990C